MSQRPSVDIVVLNHNGKRFLDDCFRSLLATDYPNYRLYLLDNGSTEDDVAYVQASYPLVSIILNPANNGFCAAYNVALNQCTGDYFVCLNNDVKVRPDWLKHLVDLAESDPGIGAIQSKLLSFFDEGQFEYAGSSGGMIDIYGFPFARGRVFRTIEPDTGQYDDDATVFWTCGAAMFIRRKVLDEVGLFDESIVHHMDEIDLNWRMYLHGYTCKVAPRSVILHYGGATIQPESFKKMFWNHRNALYMMLKNYAFPNVLFRTSVHVVLDYVAATHSIITLRFTRARAIWAAHVWLLRNRKHIAARRSEVQANRKVSDEAVDSAMYRRSVVFQYFIMGRKTYSKLISKA